MKIGFDAKRLFNNFTGLGNYSRFLLNALCAHYPDNEYWLYTPKVRTHPEIDAIINLPNVKIQRPSPVLTPLKLGGVWRTIRLATHAHRNGAQVFHGLSNELPMTKPDGLKTVVTVHDLIFKRFPEYYSSIDIRIYSWKLHEACRSADGIVAVSQQTAEDIADYLKIDSDRISVIHQGCHPVYEQTCTSEQKAAVKQKYELPDDFILNVGTIEERKNTLTLLKALVAGKIDMPVVIVGRPTLYLKVLMKYIELHHLENQVHFLPNVSFTDLPAIYQSASVFVYPSIFEGFGIPIVEAITSGLPVITSTGSCFAEAGGPATLYVPHDQPGEIAEAIRRVMSDATLRAQMLATSKAHIRQFQPGVIAEKMMGLYQSL